MNNHPFDQRDFMRQRPPLPPSFWFLAAFAVVVLAVMLMSGCATAGPLASSVIFDTPNIGGEK
jgi:hypothetical protein